MTDKPDARDWQNRAERAEAECNELRAKIRATALTELARLDGELIDIEPGYAIHCFGGNCPVQADGTVDGLVFYFRARGRRWELHVAHDEADYWTDREVFCMEQEYGEGPFDAGWMPENEALAFIGKGVRALRAQTIKGESNGQ